jgi:iron complex outermembrane receptor protein
MKYVLTAIFIGFSIVFGFGQTVKGLVFDQSNTPLQGATILLVETNYNTSTEKNGYFELNIKEGTYVLNISFLGFEDFILEFKISHDERLDLGEIMLTPKAQVLENLTIRALILEPKLPFAFININARELERINIGKDIPSLLSFTPSFVSSSDAGTGIGYSSMWVRGSDATRINVTLNGIPFNDSESLGTFWVDLPDFASSVKNIQLQRGLGTSSHGAGAFGATINLQTLSPPVDPYASIAQSFGSFDTRKTTVKLGTGMLNEVWRFEGRLSAIASEGYVDRATADMKSYYIQASYVKPKFQINLVNFSGKEVTYQSWNGVPESRIEGDVSATERHALNNDLSQAETQNLLNSDRRYNFYTYDNQVDDYKQDHYQLHLNGELTKKIKAGVALHYTKGKGFFEEFNEDDAFSNYGLPNAVVGLDTITNADIVRRRWLGNDFYGIIANIETNVQTGLHLIAGIGYNKYKGDHFGEIIWSEINPGVEIGDIYYNNIGDKSDFNSYLKLKLDLADNLILYSDLQFRRINYDLSGIDNELQSINLSEQYNFFNPKFGLSFYLTPLSRIYASFGTGNKEPNRSDFIDAISLQLPESEKLKDLELGYQILSPTFDLTVNGYFMNYEDQLILTGAINENGSPIRENVEKSYRAGIEISGNYFVNEKFRISSNITFSQNKINDFSEIIFDYTNGVEEIVIEYEKTDISFSPSIIANATILVKPIESLEIELLSRYIGKQFLDNTSDDNKKIDPYFVNDIHLGYSIDLKQIKKLSFGLNVYNILNAEYESNGYTFSYINGEKITENFYFPQAGRHIIANVSLQF